MDNQTFQAAIRESDNQQQVVKNCERKLPIAIPTISVVCNGIPAVLHKSHLGSGGKGKCIEYNGESLTPNEFQTLCGKASSKDWKRSIRHNGKPISRLIDQSILVCHAISCICAACSDDDSVHSPVRYFKKWNRKRQFPPIHAIRDEHHQHHHTSRDAVQMIPGQMMPKFGALNHHQMHHQCLPSMPAGHHFRIDGALSHTTDFQRHHQQQHQHEQQDKRNDRELVNHFPCAMRPANINNNNANGKKQNSLSLRLQNQIIGDIVNEQKCWWQLESVAEGILREAVALKAMVLQTKEMSIASKANSLMRLRNAELGEVPSSLQQHHGSHFSIESTTSKISVLPMMGSAGPHPSLASLASRNEMHRLAYDPSANSSANTSVFLPPVSSNGSSGGVNIIVGTECEKPKLSEYFGRVDDKPASSTDEVGSPIDARPSSSSSSSQQSKAVEESCKDMLSEPSPKIMKTCDPN